MEADVGFGPAASTGALRVRRRGFTMIEMILVIMIGAVLMSIALPMFAEVRARQQLENARNGFISLAQRARAEAIQSGAMVTLELDLSGQQTRVERDDGTVIEAVDYEALGVQVDTGDSADITICYSPRGYALQICDGEQAGTKTVVFSRGGDTMRAEVGALGTVEAL